MHLERRVLISGSVSLLSSRLCERPLKQDRALGWHPKTPLRDGLANTIAHFEKLVEESDNKTFLEDGRFLRVS